MRTLLSVLIVLALNANASIQKQAIMCESKMCFYYWPELPNIKGWSQDKQNSLYYHANTQAPDGYNFGNAESVIYAKAIYKPEQPESKTLEEFIANDHKSFFVQDPSLIIKELKSVKNSNGVKLFTYSFAPKNQGNWEIVTYGEEIDKDGNQYYLNFVLSSRSESALKKSFEDYKKFVSTYKP